MFSPAGSVGASKLRLEVSTGHPHLHPPEHGRILHNLTARASSRPTDGIIHIVLCEILRFAQNDKIYRRGVHCAPARVILSVAKDLHQKKLAQKEILRLWLRMTNFCHFCRGDSRIARSCHPERSEGSPSEETRTKGDSSLRSE